MTERRQNQDADLEATPLPRPRSTAIDLAVALVAAGIAFVVYPALRPYSSETGLPGAQAFASWRWTASHVSAIGGLVVLTQLPQLRRLAPIGHVGPTLVAIGAALVLPYYGAEVFGVGAVGRRVITTATPQGWPRSKPSATACRRWCSSGPV